MSGLFRHSRTLRIGAALIFVVVAIVGLRSSRSDDFARPCVYAGDVRDTVFAAPDGMHEAHTCADPEADAYWVTIRSTDTPSSRATLVFMTWEFAPSVAWRDDGRVVITIEHFQDFFTAYNQCLHQAAGIKVVYRLADRLSDENYRRTMDRIEQIWTSPKYARTHDSAFWQKLTTDRWEAFRKLKKWALANAENGEK